MASGVAVAVAMSVAVAVAVTVAVTVALDMAHVERFRGLPYGGFYPHSYANVT